jgi:hypothetical protein
MPRAWTDREGQEQRALLTWARSHRLPEVRGAFGLAKTPHVADFLIHIPNERHCSPRAGGRLKALGVRAGVSDLLFALPWFGSPGLWVEMKAATGGTVSEKQRQWLGQMQSVGYQAVVARGWQEGKDAILAYLRLELVGS